MSARETIIKEFGKRKLAYKGDIDEGIKQFIFDINRLPNIKTLISCEGHTVEERGELMFPYLAFLVDEKGWNIFWLRVLPELCVNVSVIVYIYEETDATGIMIRGEDETEFKLFWLNLKVLMYREFLKIVK